MNFFRKNKAYIIGGASLLVILFLLLVVGEIILPFLFALYIAYLLNPIICRIQKRVKNRNLAITTFLLTVTILFTGIVILFGSHIIKDTKRFVGAATVFTEQHEEQISDIKDNIVGIVDLVYENETVQNQINKSDTLAASEDNKNLVSTIGSVYSLFEDGGTTKDEYTTRSWNHFVMLIYTILYTIFILYTYSYFQQKYMKYIYKKEPSNKVLDGVWQDFKVSFLIYFKQRSKIVLLNIFIFILAFSLMDLPGAIIIGILAGILSYASHFFYLSLPLIGIGCWVLSIEHNNSFWIYFGIVVALFIVISILEETVYFNRIMKSVNGMNPAIMFFSFALWIYLLGAFTGTIVALPLTQFIMIYVGRIILYTRKKREESIS